MVNYILVENEHYPYLEGLQDGGQIESERDALDLAAECYENQTNRVLLHAANLPDDFYNLRTGLAGAVLQKFSNYSVKLAALLTPELVGQGRFKEMVLEANRRSRSFHVFYEREQAMQWLVDD